LIPSELAEEKSIFRFVLARFRVSILTDPFEGLAWVRCTYWIGGLTENGPPLVDSPPGTIYFVFLRSPSPDRNVKVLIWENRSSPEFYKAMERMAFF